MMRTKPKIARRDDGRWVVRRPSVGFRPRPDETEHSSWMDAVRSLTDVADQYPAGGSAERTATLEGGTARTWDTWGWPAVIR